MDRVKVMGVDPGLASLGWAVVEHAGSRIEFVASGCETTDVTDGPDLWRAAKLHRAMRAIIARHRPSRVVTEAWRHYNGAVTTAAHQIGMVLAAVHLAALTEEVLHVEGGRAQDWRVALGLSRTASKDDAQERVRAVLGLGKVIRPQHASDAAAVAIVAIGRGAKR